MRKIEQIGISAADRERLERLVRDRNTPQKVVWRARIVLLAGDGLTAEGIAAAVDKSLLTVRRWRRRFVAKGMDGLLKDATRPSRVKPLAPEKIKQVVDMTLHAKPPNATHWSLRSMAASAPQHGCGGGALLQQCPAHMACARAQAASGQDVQSLARQELRGQGGGRGWALPRSTRQGAGLLRRRKEPNPGPRPHSTGIAHEEGARRYHDP